MPYIDRDDFFGSFPELDIEPYKSFPTADVVEKEWYDRLLENATIISEALNKYQTADEVERKKGKWDTFFSDSYKVREIGVECSFCGYRTQERTNYCPSCGADMRKETEDERRKQQGLL